MIVYFDPSTLYPHHVMYAHDADYDPKCNGEHFIETDLMMPPERMLITANGDGTFSLSEKKDMPVSLYASQIKLGVEAIFSEVPENAAITVNSKLLGTMDGSGCFELTPTSTGFYAVSFALAGYVDWSGTLEVVSGG